MIIFEPHAQLAIFSCTSIYTLQLDKPLSTAYSICRVKESYYYYYYYYLIVAYTARRGDV